MVFVRKDQEWLFFPPEILYDDQIGLSVIAYQANQENAKLLLLFFAKFSAGSLIVDLRTTASKPEASSSGLYYVCEECTCFLHSCLTVDVFISYKK